MINWVFGRLNHRNYNNLYAGDFAKQLGKYYIFVRVRILEPHHKQHKQYQSSLFNYTNIVTRQYIMYTFHILLH